MASRFKISSGIPAVSPAHHVYIYIAECLGVFFGCVSWGHTTFYVAYHCCKYFAEGSLSLCCSSEPRDLSNSTPAPTMALNWRVNIAKSSDFTGVIFE